MLHSLVMVAVAAVAMRYDDNKTVTEWNEVAAQFEAKGLVCSFAVVSGGLSAEQGACLKAWSDKGFEIMDHTSSHAMYVAQYLQDADYQTEKAKNFSFVAETNDSARKLYLSPEIDLTASYNVTFAGTVTAGVISTEDAAGAAKLTSTAKIWIPSKGALYGISIENNKPVLKDFWGRAIAAFDIAEEQMTFVDQRAIQPCKDLLRLQARATAANLAVFDIPAPKTWIQPGGWEAFVDAVRLEEIYGQEFGYTGADCCVNSGDATTYAHWVLRPSFSYFDEGYTMAQVKEQVQAALVNATPLVFISHQTTSTVGGRENWLALNDEFIYWMKTNDVPVVAHKDIWSVEPPAVTYHDLKYTSGGVDTKWSTVGNWIDLSTGEAASAAPVDGDRVTISSYPTTFDLDGLTLDFLSTKNASYLAPGASGISYLHFAEGTQGIYNDSTVDFNINIKVDGSTLPINSAGGTFVVNNDLCTGVENGTFTIEKNGAGELVLNGNNKNFTGLAKIRLNAGTLRYGQWAENFASVPAGLTFEFTAAGTVINVRKSITFKDARIVESGTAVNGAHSFVKWKSHSENVGNRRITFNGTPQDDVTTFTGCFKDDYGLVWAPDSATKEFCFSGSSSVNTMCDIIDVRNGTVRFAKGATCSNLSEIKLAPDATLAIDNIPVSDFIVTNLSLSAASARVSLAGGVFLHAVGTVAVNGKFLETGYYCSPTGLYGTKVEWMEGRGILAVGAVSPIAESAASWTANGGEETDVTEPANWGEAESTTLPDLLFGKMTATFATGTTASLGDVVAFKGLVLGADGDFTFEKTADDAHVTLGVGGLTTQGNGGSFTYSWPTALAADQTWTVAAGDTLTIAGGLAASQGDLAIDAAGSLVFEGENTFDKKITISGNDVTFRGTNAVGASSQAITINARDTTKTRTILFDNATVDRPLYVPNQNAIKFEATKGTTNVVLGALTHGPVATTFKVNDGSVLRFVGANTHGSTGWITFSGGSGEYGQIHFDGTLNWVGAAENCNGNVAVYFNAKNNHLGSNWSEFYNQVHVYTTVPYAFSTNQYLDIRMGGMNANGFWDLCGRDQALAQFSTGANTTIRSTEAATLHLIPESDVTHAAKFVGKAGLSVEGAKTVTLTGVSSSAGNLQVASGSLVLAEGASWLNADEVIVKSGTMRFEALGTIGDGTKIRFPSDSTGKIDLAFDGIMPVGDLYFGDELQPAGTYGSTASGAKHQDDTRFSGTGILFCGTGAKVYSEGTSEQISDTMCYTGITLDTPGAFDLTATEDGRIILGMSGLTTTGKGNAYRLACPTSLSVGQTWTVGAGDTLTIAGGLVASVGDLTIDAAGALVFEGENAFDQAIDVTADSVIFRGTNAVGVSSKAITVNARTAEKTTITFDNATVDRPLTAGTKGRKVQYEALAGTTNTVLGALTHGAVGTFFKVNDGSVLRSAGANNHGSSGWIYFRGGSGEYGQIHFDRATAWWGAAENCEGNVALYFNAPNNYLGSNWSEFNNQTRVYTTVAYAFSTNQNLDIRMGGMNANGFWDLCGCDQALAKFSTGANTTIRSTEAATLHLIPASDVTHAAKFVGKAGLSVEGTKTVTLTAESPTEGDLTVKSGVLALAAGARWPKAGTVSIQGGKLDLAEGVIQKCRQLKIGDTVYEKRGTWGSSESNAEHKDDEHFSGKGVVRVRGAALIVIFGP